MAKSGIYNANQHDLGLVNVGSDGAGTSVIGMMLAQRKAPDGSLAPFYEEYDDEYLASQFFSDPAGYGNLPPEKSIAIRQDSWRSGFGEDWYDSDDPERYFSSFGMDMRHKGRAILGWTPTTVTKPSATTPSIINADMETASSGWSDGPDTAWARTAQHSRGGTYSWGQHTVAAGEYFYQDLSGYVPSLEYTFTCWMRANPINSAFRVNMDDGVSTTNGTTVNMPSSTTWYQATVTKTLSAVATRLRVSVEARGPGGRDYFGDDASISVTAPTVGKTSHRCHATFNDKEYVAFGSLLAKLNAGGTGFDLVANMGATITDLVPFQVSGTSYLFIFRGTSSNYYYMTTGEVLTESTAANKTYQYAVWVHGAADTMWANDGGNTMRSTVNPLNGGTAWSGQTVIDSPDHSITALLEWQNLVYIMKEDRPYYIDSSGNVQDDVVPQLETEKATTSGKNATIWQNKLYTQAGAQTLAEVDTSGTITFRSPALSTYNQSEFVGQIFALAHDTFYLYAVIDNSAKVEILAGRMETVGSTTSWVWHPIQEITLTGCETAWVSTVFQKRLWISSTSSGESLYYIPLPATYGNIESDTNRNFKTDGYFETPWLHGNFRADNKHFTKITASLGHDFDTDIYFECWYKRPGGSYVDAGDLKGTSGDRNPELFIPDDGSSVPPFDKKMRLKFVGKTDDTTKTPVLEDYDLRAVLYPTIRKIIACKVRVSDEVRNKLGMVDGTALLYKTTLDNARDNVLEPISIRDIDGNTTTVKLLPLPRGTPRWELVKDEQGRNQERWYNLLMMVVKLS